MLLCDEPTSALDTVTTQQILDLIKDVREKTGVTVVIITHEMAVVRETCDAVTLLSDGKIVQSGRVDEIVADTNSSLSHAIVPKPRVDEIQPGKALIDISFTSEPGEPASSQVLALVAELGADVTAGTFETIGAAQIARLALSVDEAERERTLAVLRAEGITAGERAA